MGALGGTEGLKKAGNKVGQIFTGNVAMNDIGHTIYDAAGDTLGIDDLSGKTTYISNSVQEIANGEKTM